MKKFIATALITLSAAAALIGCNSPGATAANKTTQNPKAQVSAPASSLPSEISSPATSTEATQTPSPARTAQPSPTANPKNTPQTQMIVDDLLAQLAEIDVTQDQLDVKKDDIRLKYSNGELTREEYVTQKTDLELQKDELNIKEDEVELKLYQALNEDDAKNSQALAKINSLKTHVPGYDDSYSHNANKHDYATTHISAAEADFLKQKDDLDLRKYELEQQYRSGEIDRQTFITKEAELNLEDDALDLLEEELDVNYNQTGAANSSAPAAVATHRQKTQTHNNNDYDRNQNHNNGYDD